MKAFGVGDEAPPAKLLAALSIEAGWLERWPHELSGGELQRVAGGRRPRRIAS